MKNLTPILLLPLLAAPAVAQKDSGTRAELQTTGLYSGQHLDARLSSTEIGRPAAIYFGLADLEVPGNPLKPVIHLDRNSAKFVTGTIGPDGLFEFRRWLPFSVDYTGRDVVVQGFVKRADGLVLGTAPVFLEGEAALGARFTDQSALIPAAANLLGSVDVDTADFDRDGDWDLSVHVEDKVLLFVNQGGSFADETDARLSVADNFGGASDSEWFDVDNDGDQDLLVASAFNPVSGLVEHQLWINDGTGHFSLDAAFPNTPTAANDLAVGDLDGDGDLDVILVAAGNPHDPTPDKTVFLRNRGPLQPGTFSLDTDFENDPWNDATLGTRAVTLGDVDRDGDLDVFLARSDTQGNTGLGPGEPNVLLLNDGFGYFTDATATNLPVFNGGEGDNSQDAVFVDVDGDGYLDLAVANSVLSVPTVDSGDLLLNRGAADPGVFDDAPANFPEVQEDDLSIRTAVIHADVDNDGDQDLVITPHEWFDTMGGLIGAPALYLNQGGVQQGAVGEFVRDTAFFAGLGSFISADGVFFDYDGDGDLDYYGASNGSILDPALKRDDWLLRNEVR